MKKCLVAITVALLAAFATPVLAVTDPYMEVPADHWAHDAISQLAARGVLLVGDDQPMTRFEMANSILQVIDLTKARRQDVAMLMKLVVEFKDELEALGVRTDHLNESLAHFSGAPRGWPLGLMVVEDNDDADTYD